ncbi:hypothetical protein A6833_07965 [Salmonella enterica]|uniref:Uncharacterized protein n=3 Tax=Salmonella enterica TaxID=28901 RepID=A0A5U3D1J8_SALDZ|nr:hypothetical protein [Salmonella enterica]EAA7930142.1 hypothetical protein [Salmonella enterica subsp. enterica serovar Redlands]EAB9737355.1 hypothetical protein [Salmonella enterica subsp. diarizonae]EAS9235020.1 hypothetical protein [Salmonella enterica subsp. enterica]EBW8697616.1 hypothetical protein [Salmonella enterica subsp. diarizonae serovar 16:z10:e,n,x,z15]ECG1716529.1 hypothetical protein [Salmonella enterica subsp. diarizonae serovar 17:z10:e,n,x,z15]EDW0433635.1 hypothetica
MQTYKNHICNYCNHLIFKNSHIQHSYCYQQMKQSLNIKKKKLFWLRTRLLKLQIYYNIIHRWGIKVGR